MKNNPRRADEKQFSWLHFSDFQFSDRPRGGDEEADQALYAELRRLHQELGPWHALFISGDFAFSGRSSHFSRAEEQIAALLQLLKELKSVPQVYVIPGNHDLQRAGLPQSAVNLLRYVGEDAAYAKELLDDDSGSRAVVEKSFAAFTDWSNESEILAPHEKGVLPGDFSAVAEGNGCHVGIVGLNSAFVQLGSGDYYGELALETFQIDEVCYGKPDDWVEQFDAALLLTHHTPMWLSPSSRARLYTTIAPIGRFAAHLCGSQSGQERWGDYPVIPGQLLVQTRAFRSQEKRGFVAGKLSFADGANKIQIWPRVLDEEANKFIIDHNYALDLSEGDHFQADLPTPGAERRKLYLPASYKEESAQPPLVLEYLELRNFRCFKKLLVPLNQTSSLPGSWTCIVGINGAGKSSVLEALCLALLGQPTIRELGGARLDRMRRKEGNRAYDAEIRLWMREGERKRFLELQLGEADAGWAKGGREIPWEMAEFWQSMSSRLLVAYGATRNLASHVDTRNSHLTPDLRRLMTIFDPLTQLTSAKTLLQSSGQSRVFRTLLSNMVQQVLRDELQPQEVSGQVLFQTRGERVQALDLPDGFRSSIAWMADLCATWEEKNPAKARTGDPSQIEGIVLIDELALHLHPSLQRTLVPNLREVMPRVQWIVTTHSPLVLSSFDSREIVALDEDEPGSIRKLDRQILGFSTDEIYDWLMNTPASSVAMDHVLVQQDEMDSAQKDEVSQILRSSPETDAKKAQAEDEDFRQRVANITKQKS